MQPRHMRLVSECLQYTVLEHREGCEHSGGDTTALNALLQLYS